MSDSYAKEIVAAANGGRGDMDSLIETLSEAEINAAIIEIAQPPMTLRQHFAASCDPSVYNPMATFRNARGHDASVDELAAYIAQIRCIEADALIAELAKEPQP